MDGENLMRMKKNKLYEMAVKHKREDKVEPEKPLSQMNKNELIDYINTKPTQNNIINKEERKKKNNENLKKAREARKKKTTKTKPKESEKEIDYKKWYYANKENVENIKKAEKKILKEKKQKQSPTLKKEEKVEKNIIKVNREALEKEQARFKKEEKKKEEKKKENPETLKKLDSIYDVVINSSKQKLRDAQEEGNENKVKDIRGHIIKIEKNKELLEEGYIRSSDLVKALNTTDKNYLIYAGLTKGGKNEIYGSNASTFKRYGVDTNLFLKKGEQLYNQLPLYLSLKGIKLIKKLDELLKTLPPYEHYSSDIPNHIGRKINSCAGFYIKKSFDQLKDYQHKGTLNIKELLKINKITEQNVKYLIIGDTTISQEVNEFLKLGELILKDPMKYDSKKCKEKLQKSLDSYDTSLYNFKVRVNDKDQIIVSTAGERNPAPRRRENDFPKKEEKKKNKLSKNDKVKLIKELVKEMEKTGVGSYMKKEFLKRDNITEEIYEKAGEIYEKKNRDDYKKNRDKYNIKMNDFKKKYKVFDKNDPINNTAYFPERLELYTDIKNKGFNINIELFYKLVKKWGIETLKTSDKKQLSKYIHEVPITEGFGGFEPTEVCQNSEDKLIKELEYYLNYSNEKWSEFKIGAGKKMKKEQWIKETYSHYNHLLKNCKDTNKMNILNKLMDRFKELNPENKEEPKKEEPKKEEPKKEEPKKDDENNLVKLVEEFVNRYSQQNIDKTYTLDDTDNFFQKYIDENNLIGDLISKQGVKGLGLVDKHVNLFKKYNTTNNAIVRRVRKRRKELLSKKEEPKKEEPKKGKSKNSDKIHKFVKDGKKHNQKKHCYSLNNTPSVNKVYSSKGVEVSQVGDGPKVLKINMMEMMRDRKNARRSLEEAHGAWKK